jgi:formamidopyrimidine-DNA glycosylase
MPELPEVETIARELRPLVVGTRITDVWFDWPNQIKHPAPDEFARQLAGRQIFDVDRRAKWLVLELSGSAVLAIQVKMTGVLSVVAPDEPRDRHVHVVIGLQDASGPTADGRRELRLRDTRKFGRLGLYRRDEAGAIRAADEARELFADFGPEPLDPAFTVRAFRRRLRRRRARLKTLLMDQSFLAGVGNIYADEALWRARLHPLRSAAGLRRGDERRLFIALRAVLGQAIERRGSSIDDYRAPSGAGEMQNFLDIYARTGRPCPRCGRPVRRIVVNARSTHFCSWCQRLPAADRTPATQALLRSAR